ncbi:hypothetical protein E2C01_033425 [Portunus trituberculatus]|uniref:Uncharacterized protein n=1 Tax=Portunus trituberculatus TaxID=210409 RepID=A0A5B7F5H5_PORTR|nr:hypothetical protein [Portunus trituberculatus]
MFRLLPVVLDYDNDQSRTFPQQSTCSVRCRSPRSNSKVVRAEADHQSTNQIKLPQTSDKTFHHKGTWPKVPTRLKHTPACRIPTTH